MEKAILRDLDQDGIPEILYFEKNTGFTIFRMVDFSISKRGFQVAIYRIKTEIFWT